MIKISEEKHILGFFEISNAMEQSHVKRFYIHLVQEKNKIWFINLIWQTWRLSNGIQFFDRR